MSDTVEFNTPDDAVTFVRERRKALHQTRAHLAERAGVSRDFVVALERGHEQRARPDTAGAVGRRFLDPRVTHRGPVRLVDDHQVGTARSDTRRTLGQVVILFPGRFRCGAFEA
ncbi:hypothetical protein [Pseudarthrobacter sp. N5]|uniref:hypothetical protein n=1 Tax=Pseudarthrobacter sp. N5 TaxID=3418416 RepID=UPI003CF85C94